MDGNFAINIIWKQKGIVKIDDENLLKKDFESYYFTPEKSCAEKLVFSKKNVFQELRTSFIVFVSIIGFLILMIYLAGAFIGGWWGSTIGTVLGIKVVIGIIATILIPFSTYKTIIFEKDLKDQNKISKENVFGQKSIALSLFSPVPINKVVFNTKGKKSYISFWEMNDEIHSTAPIFVIESNHKEQIQKTENLLSTFINKEHHNVEFVKI